MRVKWVVKDGYNASKRPQYTEVDDEELAECKTASERLDLIESFIQTDFDNNVKFEICEDCLL